MAAEVEADVLLPLGEIVDHDNEIDPIPDSADMDGVIVSLHAKGAAPQEPADLASGAYQYPRPSEQGLGGGLLIGDVDFLVGEPALIHRRLNELPRRSVGKAAIFTRRPLHRNADGNAVGLGKI